MKCHLGRFWSDVILFWSPFLKRCKLEATGQTLCLSVELLLCCTSLSKLIRGSLQPPQSALFLYPKKSMENPNVEFLEHIFPGSRFSLIYFTAATILNSDSWNNRRNGCFPFSSIISMWWSMARASVNSFESFVWKIEQLSYKFFVNATLF